MKKYLVVSAFILSFLISGCSEKTVYINPPGPSLTTWDVKPLDSNITYEVYDENG